MNYKFLLVTILIISLNFVLWVAFIWGIIQCFKLSEQPSVSEKGSVGWLASARQFAPHIGNNNDLFVIEGDYFIRGMYPVSDTFLYLYNRKHLQGAIYKNAIKCEKTKDFLGLLDCVEVLEDLMQDYKKN